MKSGILFLILSFMVLGVARVCNGGHGPQGPKNKGPMVKILLKVMTKGQGPQGSGPEDYYHGSFPSVTEIVRNTTWGRVAANPTLGAKLLRLHYHDCFVRGCDASILLGPTPKNNSTDKDALPNRSLDGFDVIGDIKKKLEVACSRVVSCADITTLAARDAVSFKFRKSMWDVPLGRKDERVSLASEALSVLPSPFAYFTTLLNLF